MTPMVPAQRSAFPSGRRWRVLLRWAGWALALGVALSLAIAFGFTLYAVALLPPLQRWHTELLDGEFSATRHGALDFAGYQRLEAALFDEFDSKTAAWAREGIDVSCAPPARPSAAAASPPADPAAAPVVTPVVSPADAPKLASPAAALGAARADCAAEADEALANSRFNKSGWLHRLADGAPFNRSFRLTLAQPQGHALLVHGLTDSPYSMKALAQSLHARGFEVTVLRLPGHGTLPSMMTAMSARDWSAAVRIAAKDVAARAPAHTPFYVGGYSSGGTLALQYALDALQDSALRRPDRVLLVSPAIELTPVAALAEIIDIFAVVPLPVLDKVHWQDIAPEFDPYKFNSFPVNASRQINRATKALRRSLVEAERAGRLAQLPPIVAWQSVVDSTVGSDGVAERVYARLHSPAHRLVLFDLNRAPELRGVARPAARALIERLERAARGYTLDIVSNAQAQGSRISVLRLAPDGGREVRATALDWPTSLVSLGHVALPFPADDPVYGFVAGSGRDGIPSIGSWLLRGESGAITISLGSLTRLRSNPFWELIDADVAGLVAQDLAAPRR